MIRIHLVPPPILFNHFKMRKRRGNTMQDQELTTTQKIAVLKRMGTDTKASMYKRVQLAFQILADVDWLEVAHKGQTTRAMDFLYREGFPYVSELTMGQLVEIYRKWPSEADWRDRDYNVSVMWEEIRRTQKPSSKRGDVMSWKTKAEELQVIIDQLRNENAILKTQVASVAGELKGLKDSWQRETAGSAT